jgi:hypothetical protein
MWASMDWEERAATDLYAMDCCEAHRGGEGKGREGEGRRQEIY